MPARHLILKRPRWRADGVYRTGFASTQQAYETAVRALFEHLDKAEWILASQKYIVGDRLTEADVRLYVSIVSARVAYNQIWSTDAPPRLSRPEQVRFDVAYHGAFKCNLCTIRAGYPALHAWLRKLYWTNDAFGSTTKFDHIKAGYYGIKMVGLAVVLLD